MDDMFVCKIFQLLPYTLNWNVFIHVLCIDVFILIYFFKMFNNSSKDFMMIPIKVYDNIHNLKTYNANFKYGSKFYVCM
jgi:hypothetical protein